MNSQPGKASGPESGLHKNRGTVRVRRRRFLAMGAMAVFGAGRLLAQQPPAVDTKGLWVGDVILMDVSHARNGAVVPVRTEAQLRLILHSDTEGKVRLLKEVIMGRPVEIGADILLFTDPARMIGRPVARDAWNGAVAQRMATIAYDFKDTDGTDDQALLLTGGLASGQALTGTLQLDPQHPTNPFRHKFHPDHSNQGARAIEVFRDLRIEILGDPTTIEGVLRLNGTYEETIRGLHRAPLITRGTVQLTRVSTSAVLNP